MTPAHRSVAVLVLLATALPTMAGADPVPTDPADPRSRPPLLTAGADDPISPKDLLYDGNYISVLGGAVVPALDRPLPGVDRLGAGGRLALRLSAVTQFADAEVGAEFARFGGTGGAGAGRVDLGVHVAAHPAFPLLVFNDWWNDVWSGIHGYVGARVARTSVDGAAAVAAAGGGGASAVDWRPALLVGAGVDLPVSPRNHHSGWWLTVRYEARWARFGDAVPDRDLGERQLVALIGWRRYDNGWARLPRPF